MSALIFVQYCFEMFFRANPFVVMRNVVGCMANGNGKRVKTD